MFAVVMPGQRKHAFAVDLTESVDQVGHDSARSVVGDESAGSVKQPDTHELGDGVDETTSAETLGRDLADHSTRDVAGLRFHLDGFDRAVGRSHTAPDCATLEGRTGWS